jgi:hypothetical protein
MSQTLKRPMFRKGGPVMEGIMDGIVDRQQMQTGGFLSPFGSANPVTSVSQRPGGFLFQDLVREAGRLRPNVINPRGIFSTTPTATTTAPAKKLGFKEGAKQFLQRGRGLGRAGVRLTSQGIRSIPALVTTPVGAAVALPSAVGITAVAADQIAEAARRRGDFVIEGEKFDPKTGKVTDEGTIGELGFLEQELAGSEDLPTDRPVTAREVERVRKATLEQLQKEQISARIKRGAPVNLLPLEISQLGIDPGTGKTAEERTPGLGDMGKETDDPEKTLMDAYKENIGVIEQVLNTSDEDTKAQLYLQLAKFGAGLASQPGGSLTRAIGKAAEKPLEGVSKVIADRAKEKREIKTLALSKAFEDVKPIDLEKQVDAVRRILGGTREEALKFLKGDARSPAQIAADDKVLVDTAKENGLNPTVFKISAKKVLQLSNGASIYAKALDPKNREVDAKDMVPGEYYTQQSQIVRYMPSKQKPLQEPGDPGFTESLKEKKPRVSPKTTP